MYTTPEFVKEITGYDVTSDNIIIAQTILEVYTGRLEQDVSIPADIGILARAVAYQAAYMKNNSSRTFEQISVSQIVQNSNIITFKAGDKTAPWLAPLAKLACQHLSWFTSRSIKTGRIFRRRVKDWGMN